MKIGFRALYAALILSILPMFQACQQQVQQPAPAAISLSAIMADNDGGGFARADYVRKLEFPVDHGAHEKYRHEWWYLTGNLESESGRRFGYQLTFFRFAAALHKPAGLSTWNSNQVYMAHFSLTDAGQKKFYSFERINRAALDLAGARAEPFRVWLDDWSIQSSGEDFFPLEIKAAHRDVKIDLLLRQGKSVVLQGDQGWSQKGPEPGNASYYYSFTRVPTAGVISTGQGNFSISGNSWLDREWGSAVLAQDYLGWDWFALQLDDGRDIMFYRMRKRDGSISPYSQGVLVYEDGHAEPLSAQQLELTVLAHWRSPDTGICYPSAWAITIAKRELELSITPVQSNQEMNHSVRYWEGAVKVSTKAGTGGVGYVELAGYDQPC